jgi:hypothetical protein
VGRLGENYRMYGTDGGTKGKGAMGECVGAVRLTILIDAILPLYIGHAHTLIEGAVTVMGMAQAGRWRLTPQHGLRSEPAYFS